MKPPREPPLTRPPATPPPFVGGSLAGSAGSLTPPVAPPVPSSPPLPTLDDSPLEAWAVVPPPVVEGAVPPLVILFPRRDVEPADALVDPLKPNDARGERIPVVPSYNELVIQPIAALESDDQPLPLQPASGPTREQILAELEGRDRSRRAVDRQEYRAAETKKRRAEWNVVSFRKMQFSVGGILLGTTALAVGITLSRALIFDTPTQIMSFTLLMLFALSLAAMREFERYGALLAAQVLLILYICTLVRGWVMGH